VYPGEDILIVAPTTVGLRGFPTISGTFDIKLVVVHLADRALKYPSYLRGCGDGYAVALMKLRVKGGFALHLGLPVLILSALSGCSLSSGRPPASIEIEKVDTVPTGCQVRISILDESDTAWDGASAYVNFHNDTDVVIGDYQTVTRAHTAPNSPILVGYVIPATDCEDITKATLRYFGYFPEGNRGEIQVATQCRSRFRTSSTERDRVAVPKDCHEALVGEVLTKRLFRLTTGEGNRLRSRQRESSIDHLLRTETEILRCPKERTNLPNMRSVFGSSAENTEIED